MHNSHRWSLMVLALTLASMLGGCMAPWPRTVDVKNLDIGAGEVRLAAGEFPKLLVVPVLDHQRAHSCDNPQVVTGMRVVALTESERDLLTARLGTPRGIFVEVATPASIAAPDLTGQSLAALARERGARWMLVSSVDTVSSGWSSMALVSLLTIGVLPFNAGCTGTSQAALYDLQSGERLDQWAFTDSGWQVANFYTLKMADAQMADRANHRMLRRIGKGAAAAMAAAEPRFKTSVAAAKVRIEGWGEE